MRIIKKHIDGILMADGLDIAKQKLKGIKDAYLYLTALNGTDLFIKKNSIVKVSTRKEFNDFYYKYIQI